VKTVFVHTVGRVVSSTRAVACGLALLLVGTTSDVALAQAPEKVAILDMAAALFNSDRAKQIEEQLQGETSEDEQKIRSLAEQGRALQEKMQKDAAVMSDADRRKTEEQLQEINVQYQFLIQKVQNLLNERRQQFQQTYAPNLVQAIQEVVEEGSYDLVLRADAVLHFSNAYDITARVTEKLNAQK
jgi:outer membrane protein